MYFQNVNRQWVNAALTEKTDLSRDTKWTRSIAVGCENFVNEVERKMRSLSVGRRVRPIKDGYELRETIDTYNAHIEAEKCDIGVNNTWFWDEKRGNIV